MLLSFDTAGKPVINPNWRLLGSGIVSKAYDLPGNRVLKVAGMLDGTLQWLEYCHAIFRKFGANHPRMAGKPLVYQLRRFTDHDGTERYWCVMEKVRIMDAVYGFECKAAYLPVKAEAGRVLGMEFLDDHPGNIGYRMVDGEPDLDHPLLLDPTAASYERDKPSRYKHMSAPKLTQ